MDFEAGFILGVVVAAFVAAVCMLGLSRDINTKWHKEIVTRGYAQYCTNNGEWAWKGECE